MTQLYDDKSCIWGTHLLDSARSLARHVCHSHQKSRSTRQPQTSNSNPPRPRPNVSPCRTAHSPIPISRLMRVTLYVSGVPLAVRDWTLGLMHGFGNRMQRLPSFTPLVFERCDGRSDNTAMPCVALRQRKHVSLHNPCNRLVLSMARGSCLVAHCQSASGPDSRERICSMMQKHGGSH